MATLGYDVDTGWNAATFPVVLLLAQDIYKAETSATVDVDNGPAADFLRTLTGLALDLWRDQQAAYEASFITKAPGTGGVAQGSALEVLLTPKIGPKLIEVKSTVVLPLFAAPGPDVNVPAGSAVRLGTEVVLWTLDDPVLAPGGGSIDGDFTRVDAGPTTVIAGSAWTIANPVTGWDSVGPNALDAVTGRFAETDLQYRARYRKSLSDSTVQALADLEGVTSVSLNEHEFGTPDPVFGLSHWVEYLVTGGDDVEIAETIHLTRAKGVNTVGTTSIDVIDTNYIAGTYTERFSRPALVENHVELTVTKGEDYPTDISLDAVASRENAFRDAVEQHYGALVAGQDTSGFGVACDAKAFSLIEGIANVEAKVDLVDPPVNTGILAAGTRERFIIARPDIDVIGA